MPCDRALAISTSMTRAPALSLASSHLEGHDSPVRETSSPPCVCANRHKLPSFRLPGTNDKSGAVSFVMRWVSPWSIKESTRASSEWGYPSVD